MKILYHHRTASKDGQAVHIEEMIDAMRTPGLPKPPGGDAGAVHASGDVTRRLTSSMVSGHNPYPAGGYSY